jgi:hypothetical protein
MKTDKINNPFTCLNNLFVNSRGQLADNLATSRAVLAVQVRAQREAEERGFRSAEELERYERGQELKSLLVDLKDLVRERDEVLKEGVRLAPEGQTKIIRISKFRRGNKLATEIRELKERIVQLRKSL